MIIVGIPTLVVSTVIVSTGRGGGGGGGAVACAGIEARVGAGPDARVGTRVVVVSGAMPGAGVAAKVEVVLVVRVGA